MMVASVHRAISCRAHKQWLWAYIIGLRARMTVTVVMLSKQVAPGEVNKKNEGKIKIHSHVRMSRRREPVIGGLKKI